MAPAEYDLFIKRQRQLSIGTEKFSFHVIQKFPLGAWGRPPRLGAGVGEHAQAVGQLAGGLRLGEGVDQPRERAVIDAPPGLGRGDRQAWPGTTTRA